MALCVAFVGEVEAAELVPCNAVGPCMFGLVIDKRERHRKQVRERREREIEVCMCVCLAGFSVKESLPMVFPDGGSDGWLTALQHNGSRLVHLHDLAHDGLEQSLVGFVIDAVIQGHVDRVVPFR